MTIRTFREMGFGSVEREETEFPTREIRVTPTKRLTNALLSSISTVNLLVGTWLLSYYSFPTLAGAIVPFAFAPDVLDTLGRGLGVQLDGTSNAMGRPVADTVLASVVMPATGILFATLSSTTLATLRGRQQDLRTALRKECAACACHVPSYMIFTSARTPKSHRAPILCCLHFVSFS